MRVHRYAAIALCAAVLGSCDELGTQPEAPVATSIQLSASSISVPDGSTEQVTAQVLDQDGNPMSGVSVDWASSDASVAAVSATGQISGEHPGSADVTASTGSVSATVAVTVTQVATQLGRVSDETQEGTAGETMADSLVARVLDRHGQGVPGVTVSFQVVAGGGAVSPAQVVSGDDGTAGTSWTLDSTVGDNTVRVSSPALGSQTLDFHAVGSPVPGLRFSYSGAVNGDFEASGSTVPSEQFAVGFNYSDEWGPGGVLVAKRTVNQVEHTFFLDIPGQLRTGTFSFHEGCTGSNCVVDSGFGIGEGEPYWAYSGSVTFTSVTTDRVQGTFSGIYEFGGEVNITDGTFNVPLVAAPPDL